MTFYQHGLRNFPGAPILSRGATVADYNGVVRDVSDRVPISVHLATPNKVAMIYMPRPGNDDQACARIRSVLSSDGGATWGSPQLVFELGDYISNGKWINLGCVGRTSSGRVVLLYFVTEDTVGSDDGSYNDMHAWITHNDDPDLDPGEWSTPVDITTSINNSGAYGWIICGPGDMIELQGGADAGRLVVAMYPRVTGADVGDLAFAYSDDGGATWEFGGVADGTGFHFSEPAICELRDGGGNYTGEVYINSRSKDGSSPNFYDQKRLHAIVSDVTQNFTPTVMQTTGAAAVPSNATQGSCICDASGRLMVCINSNETRRGLLAIWESTNHQAGTPTFTFKRELNNNCGYSSLREVGTDSYLALTEYSTNMEINNNGTFAPDEYIVPMRFDRAWLDSTLAAVPMEMIFPLKDATTGAVYLRGSQIRDYGPFHRHIQGHGGTGATWGDGYLQFDGSGGGVLLQSDAAVGADESRGGSWDWRSDDITFTWLMRVDSDLPSGDNVIVDGRDDTTTNTGWTLKVAGTTRYLTLEYNNEYTVGASNVSNTWASSSVADDTLYRWYLVVNKTANTVKLFRVAANGTVTEGNSTAATRSNGINPTKVRLGSDSSGTQPFKGRIGPLRFIRGKAMTTGEMSYADVFDQSQYQKTPAEIAGATRITPPELPASYANCVTLLGYTGDGGYSVACNAQGGTDHGRLPPLAGQGVGSIRCPKTGKLFEPNSWDRAAAWQYDDKVGFYIRPTFTAVSTGFMRRASETNQSISGAGAADPDYDFFPNTGSGSFGVVAKFFGSTGGSQVLFSTRLTTSPDMQCLRTDAGTFQFQVRRASGTAVNQEVFATNFEVGKWYYIGCDFDATNATGNGANKVVLYYGEYTGGLTPPASLTKIVSTSSISLSGGPHVMDQPLNIGLSVNGVAGANWGFKNFGLFNAPLGASGHQAWADVGVQDGAIGGGGLLPLQHRRRG